MTENQIKHLYAALNNSYRLRPEQIELLGTYQLKRWSKSYLLDVICFNTEEFCYIPIGLYAKFSCRVILESGESAMLELDSPAMDYIKESEHTQWYVSFRSYGDTRVALIKPHKG